jgi:hypothetical protein
MENQDLQKKIAEYYKRLPINNQDFFSKMSWVEDVASVCTSFDCTPVEQESILTETTLALLGVVSKEEYDKNIKNILKEKDSASLLSKIMEKIPQDIQEGMDKSFSDGLEHIYNEKYHKEHQIDKRLMNLPPKLVEAIKQSDYQEKLYNISTSYKMQLDDMGSLDEITVGVMTGKIPSSDYKKLLKEKTRLEEQEIVQIINQVNEEIFGNIRENLKNQDKKPAVENLPILENKKTDIMSSSGIDIIEDQKINKVGNLDKQEDSEVMINSGISIIKENPTIDKENLKPNKDTINSIIKDIENPENVNMIQRKLSSVTASNENNKPKQDKIISANHDPYHEEI